MFGWAKANRVCFRFVGLIKPNIKRPSETATIITYTTRPDEVSVNFRCHLRKQKQFNYEFFYRRPKFYFPEGCRKEAADYDDPLRKIVPGNFSRSGKYLLLPEAYATHLSSEIDSNPSVSAAINCIAIVSGVPGNFRYYYLQFAGSASETKRINNNLFRTASIHLNFPTCCTPSQLLSRNAFRNGRRGKIEARYCRRHLNIDYLPQ